MDEMQRASAIFDFEPIEKTHKRELRRRGRHRLKDMDRKQTQTEVKENEKNS
jgi:hypothetical protein